MLKKLLLIVGGILICALAVFISSPFWYPQVQEQIFAHLMKQRDSIDQSSELQQRVISRSLAPAVATSSPTPGTFRSFAFEVPAEFKALKKGEYGLTYRLSETDTSKFIMVTDGFSFGSTTEGMDDEQKSLVTGTTNYEIYHSILMFIPSNVSWFDTPTQAQKI